MRTINKIIIHCADTPNGVDKFTVKDIDSWHVERGFKRQDTYREAFNPELKAIGYHYVIYINGEIHTGRQVAEVGAHCQGLNSESIGVCLIGRDEFSDAQWASLKELLAKLTKSFPNSKIIGHCDTSSGKAQGKKCPGFDVASWLVGGSVGV